MSDSSSTYRELDRKQAARLICQAKSVLILFHVHPDGDAVGTAFALRAFVEHIGGRAVCICADELPERFGFISNGVQESVKKEAIPEGFDPDLTVSVDTASPSQLGSLYEIYKDKIDLMIDHHGKGVQYADYCIDPHAAACGEIMYEILAFACDLLGVSQMPNEVERLIYTAVSSDTGCFRYSNVRPLTHTLAARLIEHGVDGADINHRLFGIKTLKQMQVGSYRNASRSSEQGGLPPRMA